MADNPMTKSLNNTSRTILFEKFTEEKPSITPEIKNLLNDTSMDKVYEEVEKNGFIVKSFDEFLENFKPVIYQTQYKDEGGKPVFTYSLKKDDEGYSKPIEICKHSFYEVVRSIIDKKGISGKSNLDFDYELISDLLSPEAEIKKAKKIRQELAVNTEKFLECKNNNRTEEAKKYFKICNKNYQELYARYKDNAVNLLPLAIADTQVMIDESKKVTEALEGTSTNSTLTLCDFSWDNDGNLKATSIEENNNSDEVVYLENNNSDEVVYLEDNNGDEVVYLEGNNGDEVVDKEKNKPHTTDEILKKNINNIINKLPEIKNSEYMQKTFKRSFLSGASSSKESLPALSELAERKKGYIEIYKTVQQSFFDAAAELIKKVLNVEMFFKHASDEKGKFHSELIITNCGIDEIINDEEVKTSFTKFINAMNNSKDHKIWFAILPPVFDNEFAEDTETITFNNPDDEWNMTGDISEDKTAVTKDKVTIEDIGIMTEILSKANIISFFNFKASEKTGFENFNENIFEKYKEKISPVVKDFSVLSYPNFTIIPKEEKDILISNEIVENGEMLSKKEYIKIPAIYIDSAYVSAGLVAATQSVDILRQKKYKVIDDNPCVRFNLEDSDNRFKFKTIFNRENIFSRDDELTSKIVKSKLGFCYSDNEGNDGTDNEIRNAYLQIARTCSGKLLYRKLVWNYIEAYVRYENGGTTGTADKFTNCVNKLSDYCKKQMKIDSTANAVNRLLYNDNETISYEDRKIIVKFGKEEEPIDITVSEAEEE